MMMVVVVMAMIAMMMVIVMMMVVVVIDHERSAGSEPGKYALLDWIVADILAIRQGALGHVRYVLKDGLKWLPLYGCYFSQHGGIYVKRSARFREKEMRQKLLSYVSAGTPMYLVIFPEGTRYNPELTKVISASQMFAAQEGLPVLKHVLTPRVKATHIAFDSMKNYLDAVYDVTVAFEGTVDDKGQRKEAPSMVEFLCKDCPKIHIHVARIDKKDVPEERDFMRRWLHERFEIKDKLLIEFYDSPDPDRRNRFPGESVSSKLSLRKTLPSLLVLSGLTAGMLATEAGRKLYVKTWLYGTLLGCLWEKVLCQLLPTDFGQGSRLFAGKMQELGVVDEVGEEGNRPCASNPRRREAG
ncbi:PREDICTED: 1-acyl-sn-glycerol-3-phosphate acyltransferase epsilon [Myotis brandtii]|uniref:1-acyl-sn-glycerol-3-phosphate acyltransferase epsilon n=1 Tax=Myotis brandtii TaxID=109478 RepID=UPI0007041A7D|nr:PREDICTED: 1-acyl-sn-glycerol-3-phosphate acyltransferase epsilon [Myotis brandtii]